jgi:hypothetical protein
VFFSHHCSRLDILATVVEHDPYKDRNGQVSVRDKLDILYRSWCRLLREKLRTVEFRDESGTPVRVLQERLQMQVFDSTCVQFQFLPFDGFVDH